MTGVAKGKTIVENISQASVIANKTEQSNYFKIDLTRVSARIVATIADETMKIVEAAGQKELGSLSGMKWTVRQFNKSTFISEKTPFHSYGYEFDGAWVTAHKTERANYFNSNTQLLTANKFVKYGDAGWDVKKLAEFDPQFIPVQNHAEGQYRKGNTAYVYLEATFEPAAAILATGQTVSKGSTFYVGTIDGLVYGNLDAAKKANNNKVKTYKDGKMVFFSFINPVGENEKMTSEIRRNTFYQLQVKGFSGLGFPNDPLDPSDDPKDPDSPDPDDPGKPDEPLQNKKTFMAVECTIVPWTVVSNEVVINPND